MSAWYLGGSGALSRRLATTRSSWPEKDLPSRHGERTSIVCERAGALRQVRYETKAGIRL
jgi:hypothetical protein